MSHRKRVPVVLLLIGATSRVEAQEQAPAQGANQPGAAQDTFTVPTEGGQIVLTPGQAAVTQTYVPPPGYPAPGTDINEGLPSSSRPVTGDQTDSFDLDNQTSGPAVVRGSKGAPGVITLGGQSDRPLSVPELHVVKRGDTLWDLSNHYYRNPWRWPKVWSYNPQIENPHWIYPGDQVRLKVTGGAGVPEEEAGVGGFLDRRSFVPNRTVFLRDYGYIGDPDKDVWGELVGAQQEQTMLSYGNTVYLTLRTNKDVRPGQELTVFRPIRAPEPVKGSRKPPGEIVKILGTVRVTEFDPDTRIARGPIVESVDVIERGAKLGPVGRQFDVVPPKKNTVTVWARVLTSFYPHVYLAQNQVLFIDKGSKDGLVPGNRLLVLRKGDTWRRSLDTGSKMVRDRLVMESAEHTEIETTPLHGNEEKFPEEIVGELRVLRTEQYSSIALVTSSRRELVPGDRAVAKEGY